MGDPGGMVSGPLGRGGAGWGCANGVGPPPWVVLVSYTDCRLKSGSFIDQQSQVCEQEMILKTLEVRTDVKQLTRDTCGARGGERGWRRGWWGEIRLSPVHPPPQARLFPCKCMNVRGSYRAGGVRKKVQGDGLKLSHHPSLHSQEHHTRLHSTWFHFQEKKLGTAASPPYPLTPARPGPRDT